MEVEALNIYPIKSCSGISLPSMRLCAKGPLYDREWMIVKEDGGFVTARQKPQLLTTIVGFTDDKNFIEVRIPNKTERLYLPLDESKIAVVQDSPPALSDVPTLELNQKDVRVWKVHCKAEDVGDAAAKFFSEFIEKDVRLVRGSSRVTPRKVGDDKGSQRFLATPDDLVGYADGFPFLLASTSSLEDLNKKIEGKNLPMRRFRPNIVIKGAEPWKEDSMGEIKIGDYEFLGSNCCARCKMTTVDQNEGKFDGKEPLETLGSFRKQKSFPEDTASGLMFGLNLIQLKPDPSASQSISIGAPVVIVTPKDRSNLVLES